jgi:hypothetical protein
MARITINKRNGTATPYFWTEAEAEPPTQKTVYKQTSDGVKRMKGVHFDVTTNQMVKH